MASEGLPLLVAQLAAGAAADAPTSLRQAAAASAKELARIACLGKEQARRVAEEPGALPALVAAIATGDAAAIAAGDDMATASTRALVRATRAGPDIEACVAEVPGALHALLTTAAGGGGASTECMSALGGIAAISAGVAHRVAQVPQALPTLIAAMAGGSAAEAPPFLQLMALAGAGVLFFMTLADRGLTRRILKVPEALPVLFAAVGGWGVTANISAVVLKKLIEEDKELVARHAAANPGALPALVAAVAAAVAAAAPGHVPADPWALTAQVSAFTGGPVEQLGPGCSTFVLALLADVDPVLARRMIEAPRALPALVAGAEAGGGAADFCTLALGSIGRAAVDLGLASRVAQVPGVLPALTSAARAARHGGNMEVGAMAAHGLRLITSWAVAAAGAACAHCGAKGDKAMGKRLRVCTGCRAARYCNAECQRLAWRSHKVACRTFAATRDVFHGS